VREFGGSYGYVSPSEYFQTIPGYRILVGEGKAASMVIEKVR
jgi:hypothetical protein